MSDYPYADILRKMLEPKNARIVIEIGVEHEDEVPKRLVLDDRMLNYVAHIFLDKTRMKENQTTAISNEALKELTRWVRTIICTNCGEIGTALEHNLKDSGYIRYYRGLLDSANKVSIESHCIDRR